MWRIVIRDPRSKALLHLGQFEEEEAAASFAECAKMQLHHKEGGASNSVSPMFFHEVAQRIESAQDRKRPSPYHGVSLATNKGPRRWRAQVADDGKCRHVGSYATEEEAAQAFDAAFRRACGLRKKLLRRLNFKNDDDYFTHETWQSEPVPENVTSRFMGVSRSGEKWVATLLRGIKRVGQFDEEVDAAIAFDKASLARGEPTNFNPKEYSVSPPGSDGV